MLLAQITDCHVVAAGELLAGRIDSAGALRAAIDHLHALSPRPDLVLATGDLVNDARIEEYDQLEHVLTALEIPLLAIAGNHDDRGEVRRRFVIPAGIADHEHPGLGDTLCYVVDHTVGDVEVRLVGVDTTVPGAPGGTIGDAQLAWLDERLSEQPDRPTIVFQHHPPFHTGIQWMDDVGLTDAAAEAAVIRQHPHVMAVVCGHVHRPITSAFAGTVASCWPSTASQVELALDGSRYAFVDEAPAVALHLVTSGGPTGTTTASHLSVVGRPTRWFPDWAIAAAQAEKSM